MSNHNNGGPAFPQAFAMSPKPDQGMTLRDYFAAKAMASIIAKGPLDVFTDADDADGSEVPNAVARGAYDYADAMLAAREKGGAA